MFASNTSNVKADLAAALFEPRSLAVVLAMATPGNQFKSRLAKSQEKLFSAEGKSSWNLA